MTKRNSCKIMRLRSTLDSRGQRPGQDPANDVTVASGVYYSREPMRGLELEQARQIDPRMSERVQLYTDPSWQLSTDDYLVDEYTNEVLNIGEINYPEGIAVEATLLVGRAA